MKSAMYVQGMVPAGMFEVQVKDAAPRLHVGLDGHFLNL